MGTPLERKTGTRNGAVSESGVVRCTFGLRWVGGFASAFGECGFFTGRTAFASGPVATAASPSTTDTTHLKTGALPNC